MMGNAGMIQTLSQSCDERFWRLYEAAPQAALDAAGSAFRYALPMIRVSVPLVVYQGRDGWGNEAATLVTAGVNPWLGELVKQFFKGEPQVVETRWCPVLALPWMLRGYESAADLIVARVDRLTSRALFPRKYLAVPEWVGMEIPLPENQAELFKNESVKSDVRRIKKYGLEYRISREDADFERFYNEYHVPFVKRRHGGLTYLRSSHRLIRIFRRGGLIWIEQKGRAVAGVVFERRADMIRMIVMGLKGDDAELMSMGAPSATYYYSIQLAYAEGRGIVELGGVRPVLNDGILKFKRKWGTHLADKRDIYHDYMVHINEKSAAARAFLTRVPLIYHDRTGLCGLGAVAPHATADNPLGYPLCPGLRRLRVLGGEAMAAAIAGQLPDGAALSFN